MKRPIFLLFLCIALLQCYKPLYAQGQLWGMTSSGGAHGHGVIFRTNADGTSYIPQYDFTSPYPGGTPTNAQLTEYNGKLYGMTYNGGIHGIGVLFEYDPSTDIYQKKLDFAINQNGGTPNGKLIVASNGKMYGCTEVGGGADSQGRGVIFEYNPVTNTCVNKAIFYNNHPNGEYPKGSLVQASNGKLYGTTWGGGAFSKGVLFEFDPATGVVTKKADFSGVSNGARPAHSLVEGANGKLYGLTTEGGANNQGVIYEFDPATSVLTKKADFTLATTGGYSLGHLTKTNDGKLYGMTQTGGTVGSGTLFEFDPANSTLTTRFSFNQTGSGYSPRGSLMLADNGNLYGLTSSGGAYSGTLFEFNPVTLTFTKKINFNGTNGYSPQSTLMQASNGKLYGLTAGGAGDKGVIFEYDIPTNVLTKKIDIAIAPNGKNPVGDLVLAGNGKMYGVTREGGAENKGVLFEYDPVTSTFTKKYDFLSSNGNGYEPGIGLILASNGKLYGTTINGGGTSNSVGVMFEFDPATGTYLKKIDFTGVNGINPYAGLVQASNGKLYGLTRQGGSSGFNGVLFEYDLSTNTFAKKFEFSGANGTMPWGSAFQASNGKLYGMTNQGGSGGGFNGYGVFYEYDLATSIFTKWLDFGGTNGHYPGANSVIEASNGKLYGLVSSGGVQGPGGGGVLFEFDKTTNVYTKKMDFFSDYRPCGRLTQAPNGNLYGLTATGGSFGNYQGGGGYGTISEYNPTTSTYARKHQFTGIGGALPEISASLIYVGQDYKSSQSITFDASYKTYGDAAFAVATASSSLPVSITSSNPAVATVSGNMLTIVAPGTTIITANQAGNALYNAAPTALYTLTVHKATLIATAENKTRTFGDTNPPLTISYSGFRGSETAAMLDVAPVATTTALQYDNAGSYPITLSAGNDNNYEVTLVNGLLSVTPASLTVTAANHTKIYGDINPTLTLNYSGFKGADTESVLDVPPGASTTSLQTSNAGSYPITAAGGNDNNYAFVFVNGVMTINKALLTATAENKTRIFGDNNSPLTIQYNGFKGTDDADDLDTPPTPSCVALATSDAGTYPISLSPATDDNYTFTLVNGTLTVNKALLTVTAVNKSKIYGDANPPFAVTYFGFKGTDDLNVIDDEPTITSAAITSTSTGTYSIDASAAQDNNYTFAYVPGVLTITKALLEIIADNKTRPYNTANPTFTFAYNGFKGADNDGVIDIAPSGSTTAGIASPVGTYPITVAGGSDNNYNFSFTGATLTITKADQTITFSSLPVKLVGDPDFNLTATVSSGLAITYTSSNPAVATVSGNTVTILASGTTTITALQTGNSNYNAAPNAQQVLTVNKGPQTITFNTLPSKVYGDASFTLTATASSGLPISYASSNPAVASVSGNTVTIIGAGTSVITASQPGNTHYYAAADVMQTLTVNKANQSVTFNTLASKTYGDTPFTLTATSSSGLPVSFSSGNGSVATVSGNTVTIIAPGATTITASQPGNTNYNAATNVPQTFTVNKASQSITFAPLPAKIYSDAPFAITATATSGLAVSFSSSNTSVATVSGNSITIVGAGTSVITASQSGNANYNAATSVPQTLTVNKANQTITFNALASQTYGDAPYTLAATSSSGLAITYASSNTAVLTISGNIVTIVGAGTANITASQAGNTNYNAATNVVQSQTVNKANQTITFATPPTKTYASAPFSFSGTASSGLPVSYAIANPAVATVSASTCTIVGFGVTQVTASQPGNANFNAATPVVRDLTIDKATQTITFAAISARTYGDAPFTLSASASSGLTVSYASSNTSVITISGNVATVVGAGSAVITASQSGNTNYLAATPATQSVTVNKAAQTISFSALPTKAYGDAAFALSASASSGLPVTYTSTNTSVATVSGNLVTIIGVGTSDITATQPGDANYNAAVSVAQTLTVTKANQSITFDPLAAVQCGDTPFALNATASSGLAVSYTSSDPSIASVSGSTVTIVNSGTVTITASQSGNVNYNAATSVSRTLTVNKANQTISFGALAAVQYNDPAFTLTSTTSSGLPVSFSSSNTSVATVSGNTVTIIGVGTTTITASQAGNAQYNAAANIQQTLTVSKDDQLITFGTLPSKVFGDAPFSISATASSTLTVAFSSSNTSVATVSGSTITIVGVGSTTITASQTGNALYNAATPVNQVLTVTKLAQTISFGPLTDKVYGDAPFTISATASSGLPVTFSSTNTTAATVSGNTVTIVGPGAVTIVASQPGNANYEAATEVNQSFNVTLPPPTEAASYIDVYDITSSGMTIEFFPGDGNNRIVIMKAGSPVTFTPVNNTSYPVGYNISGNVVVMNDAGFSVTATALTANTRYYIKIIEYNEINGFTSYMTASATASARTLAASPGFSARTTSGQNTDDGELNISVLGNPFKTSLSIVIQTPKEEEAIVGLIGLNGKVVHNATYKTNRQIDIEEPIVNGVYVLRVRTRTKSKAIRVMRMD